MRDWLAPADAYTAGHRGIDIAAPTGTPVFAPADGVVFFSGRVVDRSVLSISHSDGYLSSYEPIDTTLRAGDTVQRGVQIGVVATSAHCSGACLHLGLRLGGEYLSPLLMLETSRRAVLLPVRLAGEPACRSPAACRS